MNLAQGSRSVILAVPQEEATQRWFEASGREWAADMPIWDNKRHVPRPLLTGDDRPVPTFRRWYSRFCSEDVTTEEAIGIDRSLSHHAKGEAQPGR